MRLPFGLNKFQLRVFAILEQHCQRIYNCFVPLAKRRNLSLSLSCTIHLGECILHSSTLQSKKPKFRRKNDSFVHSEREHLLITKRLTSKAKDSFSCPSSFWWNKAKVL